jgi:hypothetical protein
MEGCNMNLTAIVMNLPEFSSCPNFLGFLDGWEGNCPTPFPCRVSLGKHIEVENLENYVCEAKITLIIAKQNVFPVLESAFEGLNEGGQTSVICSPATMFPSLPRA